MKKGAHETQSSEGKGIASFVLGIIGIVLAFVVPALGFALCVIGLIFGYMQKKHGQTRLGYAGVILNIIGIALAIIFVVALYFILKSNPDLLAQLQQAGGAQ